MEYTHFFNTPASSSMMFLPSPSKLNKIEKLYIYFESFHKFILINVFR